MSALRIGVLLDGPRPTAWAAWVLRSIAEHRDLALAFALLVPPPPPAGGRLFALYEWLDRRIFAAAPDASRTVDCSALLAGVPRGPDEVDVVVRLGRARGVDLPTARHGVWSPRFGRLGDGAPPLLWELSARAPVVEVALELQDGNVISRTTFRTDVVSLERNRNAAYWKGARLMLRALDELAGGREPPALGRTVEATAAAPTAAETARHVAVVTGRVARRKLHDAVRQHQWFVGLRRRPSDRLPQEDAAPWRPVLPPADRSYADPFVLRQGTETFVFLEELLHRSGRGRLGVGRLEDGELRAVEPILPCEHHTSYPYVFRHDGSVFLIPESGDVATVRLYAARRLPGEWELVATLLQGVDAVDATVVAHSDLLWMWLTVGDETHLYLSDALERGWSPHPRNPVVTDARTARPGGRPFLHHGRLIRPSQNCAERYGGRIIFNEVLELTPDAYRERPLGSLGAEWAGAGNLAAHTYTFDGDWEATDGLRTFARLSAARPRTATTPG
jgi:hypothetical protein